MTKKEKKSFAVREKIGEMLDMPIDILKGCPRMTVIGNESLLLENHQGIIEYEEDRIRFHNHVNVLGQNLLIEEITDDDILITGQIKSIEWEE